MAAVPTPQYGVLEALIGAAYIDLCDNATFARTVQVCVRGSVQTKASARAVGLERDSGRQRWGLRVIEALGCGASPLSEYQATKFLNWTDDPRHKRLRSLVNKGFTNRAIHALEAELRRRAVALIDALPEGEFYASPSS